MHSGHSDGALLTEKLVDTYNRHGFSVLCVSDHNCFGDQDGGILPHLQTDSIVHDWNGDGIVHPELHFGSGVEASVLDHSRPQQRGSAICGIATM
jgi:histidinol phosphatase-like PHP family hydrolase